MSAPCVPPAAAEQVRRIPGKHPAVEQRIAEVARDAPTEVTTLGPMARAMHHILRHGLATAAALFDESVPALLEHGSAIPIDHIGLWPLLRTAVGDRDRAARETLRGHKMMMAVGIRAALGYADAIAAGRAGHNR